MTELRERRLAGASLLAQHRGMTLIELMIVVVIVGILASVAYPSYREYVLRGKRAEAKALIMDITARMERYFFDNNTYTADLTELGFGSANPESAEGNYTASAAAGASGDINTSYEITVDEAGSHDDPVCGALSLDSRGTKASESGTVERCWQ